MKRRLIDNLRRVGDRIAAAAERSERQPEDIQLVAVTKLVEMDVVRQLLDLGIADLGESRVQVLVKRAGMLDEQLQRRLARTSQEAPDQPIRPRWHMVGHLQRNKVRVVLPWIELIHSLDSLRLAEEISAQAVKANREVRALIQVNPTAEKTKFGVAVGAAIHLAEQIVTLPKLRLIGLMAMAPLVDDPEKSRPYFERTRELFEEIRGEDVVGPEFVHLSMGMSSDYVVAVEEGATMVRIGTALFDGLPSQVASEA
ncbi:MAG TPA: YggS family pyridoxal phosphate-dependent enzyme [Phycisphaerae bacterium]|nr:YggS family pyridoxal phosphate-dependent enzyme [Phycisphaerae bacterium]